MSRKSTTQLPEEREAIILDFLHKQGSIRTGDVMDLLDISPSTSRLLLQKMQDKGLLKRTHGGAVLPEKEQNEASGYQVIPDIPNESAKRKVAAAAAATVEDGDYISIGSGTTTLLMAQLLHGKKDLTIVTDSVPIAYEFLNDDDVTIYICGGWILKRISACRGRTAESFFTDITVDKAYNTADSFNVEIGTASIDFDPRTESAICHSGKKCYILADSSKFKNKPSIDKVVAIDEIDGVFTDDSTDAKYIEALREKNIEVFIGN